MKHSFIRIILFSLFLIGTMQGVAQNKKSGNPILPGFHADPEVLYSHLTKRYYIYPTSDGFPGWGGSYFKVFSSKNLKTWKEETVILEMGKNVSWANGNAWAPCIEEKKIDGKYKYFFYYSANPTTNKGKQIGVAVADSPTGPFTDLGKPIITSSPTGRGQQIDVDVFTDPVSGKSYLYWGNGYMAGAEPYVIYRKGVYYFFWSVDDTGSPNYHVAYGTARSPLAPIEVAKEPIILIQNPEKEIYGPAHNSILQIPGKDKWYIVYHRINKNHLKDGPGWHREVCIDRMEFNPDGTIKPVVPTP